MKFSEQLFYGKPPTQRKNKTLYIFVIKHNINNTPSNCWYKQFSITVFFGFDFSAEYEFV